MLRNWGLRPGDWLICAAVLALAGLAAVPFWTAQTDALTCEIRQGEDMVQRVRLADGYRDTIALSGTQGTSVIEIDGKTVRFAASDCPDQVCVRTGTLSRAGQMAVCLPNQVVVRLTGAAQPLDAIAS